ncbi:MAG: glycosyltransferase family 2 protein [Myxococcales bacterium]|nr:glycosyltransferase family 2 protein [Myxococcales bacterium]
MFSQRRVAVVVPAYNEADKIERTLASIPRFVDHVIVVDDASGDETSLRAGGVADPRVEVIRHAGNRGVGAALVTGYERARALGADVTAVMAGDSQMDPRDLPHLVQAVVAGIDYAKGNRFAAPGVYREMPLSRLCGNLVLSHLTRVCSGLWHVFDSQCGYTAASRQALDVILGEPTFPRYGYPNDVLVRLALAGVRVADVPVRPVYGPTWRSGIRPHKVAWPILRLLGRGLGRRLLRRLSGRTAPARASTLSPEL